MVSPRDVTALRGDWSRGNRTAVNESLPLVYAELRRAARHALDSLQTVDAELAKIVELRAFAGLTMEEVTHVVLSVSPSTAKCDWRTAKARLQRELGSEVRP
jgi:DNA-directed RNA polymerase specialized sigma24 family protein